MTEETLNRKLAAILSADVVGYSRLIGDDEDQQYFADGLTEDIIVELARFNKSFGRNNICNKNQNGKNAVLHAPRTGWRQSCWSNGAKKMVI